MASSIDYTVSVCLRLCGGEYARLDANIHQVTVKCCLRTNVSVRPNTSAIPRAKYEQSVCLGLFLARSRREFFTSISAPSSLDRDSQNVRSG